MPPLFAGTTHLLIGSSSTPNAVPAFLTNVIPPISTTLLALDISANFLVALPPVLQACVCLEELNIASNPLRALPVFLAGLTSLRVLIADSTGISTLPTALSSLEKLHTLSIRRNKMNSLPSWLCLLPVLETLLVDGNPFQGPWKALVEPLLAKVPMTPLYPPSTPIFPPPSASVASVQSTVMEDVDDAAESSQQGRNLTQAVNEDEDTIMPARAPPISRSLTSSAAESQIAQVSPTLSRTRTTPNRAYFDKYRPPSKSVVGPQAGTPASASKENGERELRKMKSAGELRRSPGGSSGGTPAMGSTSPQRPAMSHYTPSASSSNLLTTMSSHDSQELPKRFASLGVSSALSPEGVRKRPAIDPTVWDGMSAEKSEQGGKDLPPVPPDVAPGAPPTMGLHFSKRDSRYSDESAARGKEETKSTRWGFLKKMSMGKIRSEAPTVSRTSSANARPRLHSASRPSAMPRSASASASEALRTSATPQIDVRISTTGALLQAGEGRLSRQPSAEALKSPPIPTIHEVSLTSPSDSSFDAPLSPPPASPSMLALPQLTTRASKRRSFLPIEMSPMPSPAASTFGTGSSGDEENDDSAKVAPSPIQTLSMEAVQRREEEKAREARTRALRSVMAYLRDMHDLGLTQVNTMSMYGGPPEVGTRSRRPTVVDNSRLPFDNSIASLSSIGGASQLRSPESRTALRSGNSAQTNSVATTDSSGSGSGEERKFKDDKGKRARIVREIVEYGILSTFFYQSLTTPTGPSEHT